ncbi:MAG: twin-arginine translocase TatA/TatE family subunit [Mariprofundaceae bacterium]|nr:twin-arginine translocase TatA/TatE family subunit [Mariprofundaceae bacterium]
MPDIGLFELVLIGALAFIVLGPERLPEFFGQIGRMLRHARRWAGELRQQWLLETGEIRGELNQISEPDDGSDQETASKPGQKESR